MKNPYGLEGPIGSYGGWIKDQCCLMQSCDPRPLGRTHDLANISGVKD